MALSYRAVYKNCNYIYSITKPVKWSVNKYVPLRIISSGICYHNNYTFKPLTETKKPNVSVTFLRQFTSQQISGQPPGGPQEEKKPGLIQRFKQKMAHIDDHWCTCHKTYKLSINVKEAHEAAFHLVEHLNSLVHDYPQCAKLKLAEILEISEMHVSLPHQEEGSWREFMVVVRMTPGGGVFEGTMRKDGHTWSLVGTASRLNLYGDQSRCVHHYQLKLYCFCH